MATMIITNQVLLTSVQFADGSVLANVRGEVNGNSVRVAASAIPPVVVTDDATGQTFKAPRTLTKGDALYVAKGILEQKVGSNYRTLHGKVSVELPVGDAPAAPAPTAPVAPAF